MGRPEAGGPDASEKRGSTTPGSAHPAGAATLLLLGASHDQLFAIRTAQEKGVRTLVVDYNPDSPGFALADDFAVVSTRDIDALKALCDASAGKGFPVSGVLVMGSDIPDVVAEVALHLGTPGPSPESARLATNKLLMKQRFQEKGVPIPWFSEVESAAHLAEIVAERGWSLILKPVDRSGGRGVLQIREGCSLEGWYRIAHEQSFSGQVMVEEYIPGLQISTESILWEGVAHTPGFVDRTYDHFDAFYPHIIENGGIYPSSLSGPERLTVERLVQDAALALGISTGVVKGDIVCTPDGPRVIEIAARLSGGDFSESLIPLGIGVNIVDVAIDIALGRVPDLSRLQPRFSRAVANRYFFPEPGVLRSVEGADALWDEPWLHKMDFWYHPGDVVPAVKSHADRFGVFIVTGETRDEVEARIRAVYECVRIETAPKDV